MEEIGEEGPIQCIFLCEFHPTRGPIIVCQYPENFAGMSKELFDSISVYLIPKPQLKKHIITVNVSGLKITGFPNEIKNPKYARNALIFNLCFVCSSKSHTVQYEPVVKKLSEYLENLELENGFLSNEKSKHQLPRILEQILTEMNSSGQCIVKVFLHDTQHNERRMSCRFERKAAEAEYKSINANAENRYSALNDKKKCNNSSDIKGDSESIEAVNSNDVSSKEEFGMPYVSEVNLKKVVSIRSEPVQAQDHHVPFLVCSRNETTRLISYWDLTTQHVLPYIDGMSHIAKIAAEADVDVNLVKACIQNLVYYRLVKLVPIFQYSNMYTVLPGIHKLYASRKVQEDCLKTICKSSSAVRFPVISDVLQLYSSLTYGVSIRDLCLRFSFPAMNIDERKLIQYGVLNGFIQRLYQYPVFQSPDNGQNPLNIGSFYRMCNGLHSIDEICCKFGLTYQEVNERLERDSNVIMILK